ncbi:hydrocephalus-inducing protein-like [Copidosoma floridanum]|uniref:hydrocephalus-inducing protein-like n=1 Tax=Copidosoma floridanum TaxID=29053 RepID=UPI0006C9E560|nr:hydrocephalus-inducing protein-like [Copidosoma floridanum]
MRINAVPLLKCIVSEPYKEYGDVNEHVLTVSAVSYYTRFLIEPHPKLDFGALELKATKTMQLKLTNTGQFPLKFSFVNRLANNFDDRSSVVTDRGKRSSKQRKISKRKLLCRPSTLQNVSMKFGPFKLEKIKGALAPGEVDIVNVHCVSDTVGRFNETLNILVSDSLPANDENQLIHLTADVCVANLDLENLHEVFTSSHIVETLDDFSCPNEFGQYTVFEKTSKCLYFYHVCVGCNYTTEIKLRNSSAVNGTVLIEIPENSASNGTFRVDQSRFSIPSMSTRSFSIIFAPKFLGDSSNTLLIKLDLPESIKPKNFSIDLKGVGCVPQIRLIEPVVNGSDVPVINFGLTFVSATTIKVCKVKNVGLVSAEVSLQFFTNQDAAYKVVLNERDDKTVTDHSSSNLCFGILPEEVVDVRVAFLPTKSGKYEGRLQCSVQHNPYEVIEVNLVGEGFLRTIILENLELVDELSINLRKSASKNSRDSQKSRKVSLRTGSSMTKLESKSRDLSPLTYKLDYGNCFLNQIQKVAFRIVNKTLDRFFRFEWDSLACLICTPAAGHLGPNSFKELTATFLALEPTALNQIPLSCDINEIILVEPITEPLWDNRQMTVSWMEKYPSMSDLETYEDNEEDMYMKKMIKEIEEPLFHVVPETLETVRLLVSATVNYSEYQCNINAIKFEDTLMFQTSQQTIELINVGKVDMNFSWDLVMDEQYPKRLNQIDSGLNFSLESFKKTSDRKRYTVKTTPISALKKDLRFDCEEKLLFLLDSTSSREKSDLFSSSAGMTDRSTDSWIEGENWPFKIEPESGCIAPGNSIKCFLKFLPVDVFEYKACLQCKIENLHPSATPLVIAVAAKSLLPYCHFEIEESDYLTSSRRDMKLPIPSEYSLADPDVAKHIRIAEFNVLGIKECHILQICFVNPTTEDYSYRWLNVPHVLSKKLPEFRCLSETGTVEKGKRIRTEFSMVSENVGLFESLWQFEIKKYNLKTLFIIVVNVAEPSICCKNPILKFETSTIGQVITNSFEIVNNECCQLSFNIVKSSLYSEGRLQEISIFPISGELNPYATQLFNVKFKSRLIGEFTFNVQCQIEKLQKPINIFVSTQVIEISSQIAYTNWDDQELNMSENLDNIIEVEQLLLNVPTRIKFKISNTGGIAFDYMWQLNAADRNNFKVWFSESVGRVEKGCHNVCFLELIVTDKVVIRNYPVTIKLKNGPTYRIKLNASVKKLPLEFSFDEHDFGLCYIKKDKGFSHSKTLNITNNQKIPFSIQCDFVDTPNVKLDLCQLREAISPKSQIKIPIYFQPTEEMSYKEIVLFQVPNISLRKEIVIRGEGIPIQVHLKYPCDGILNFGSILVGNETTKKLSIVNSGRATVTLKVVVTECWAENIFSINTESRAKDERNSLTPTVSSKYSHTSSKDVNLLEFLEVAPNDWFDLKMNREQLISIKFQAMQRVRSCKIKLGLDMDNTIIPLTVVKAECIAMNLYLSRTNVSFGNIFETCVAEEKLTLMNDGDVDTRFYWRDITSDFEIHPQSGHCPAGRYVIFTCTFKPQCLGSCLQAEAVLELKDYKKLTINMIGNCCPLPEAKDTINFTAETNKSDKKDIIIENNSNETWSLTPKIEGKRFTVDAILHVNPKSSFVCTVTYNPEKQLSKEFYDKGKLIIVLPNGRPPIVHDLCGHISQVLPTKNMVRQLPAKKKFVETLTLHNGSETSRIFDCSTNELTENNIKKISSFEVEVPSRSQKEYKYPFYFETEGHYVYQITFDDHQNNRQCYKIEFTVTCPESQETIKMSTYVRSPTFHTLKIENSLDYRSVTFDANDIDDVVVHGLPMTLLPMEFRFVRVEYSPLLPCDKRETLIMKSEDQDEFSYCLHLMAKPAPPEKVTYVKSSLGRTTDFTLRAKNYSKVSCRFEITASHLAFTCPQFVDALENEEVLMHVRFEPYALETVDATIKMKSSIAGEFTYPVVGQCTPPQPEGPLAVSPNAPTSITFKNIFLEAKSFEISVDNSDFVLEDSKAQINSKESQENSAKKQKNSSPMENKGEETGMEKKVHTSISTDVQ